MNSVFNASLDPSTKSPISCLRCFERKVKCDREMPCNKCKKHNVECTFRPHSPRKKRRVNSTRSLATDGEAKTAKTTKIIARVTQAPTPSDTTSPATAHIPTPISNLEETEHRSVSKTQFLQDSKRSTFVDNSLWTRVAEELQEPDQSPHTSSEETEDEMEDDDQLMCLGIGSKSSRQIQHPTRNRMLQLWEIYKTNVDPLLKIVHVPSLDPVYKKAIANFDESSRGLEALIVSIYSIAVFSLPERECIKLFGRPLQDVLPQFVSSTRLALSRANFMTTTNLAVLQALMFYLLLIRDTADARLVYSLNGVAIRLAEGMGLHRDGAEIGLPPFETEMRRRIWWMLQMHDWKTAELAGHSKFESVYTRTDGPKPPTNVNDNDIFPGMTKPPVSVDGATDMMFCALRSDYASQSTSPAARTMAATMKDGSHWDDAWSKGKKEDQERMLKLYQERIEKKYIRYCEPTEPIHLQTMVVARVGQDLFRFALHHPRRWIDQDQVPEEEREIAWQCSFRVLEKFNMAQTNPLLEHFAWHVFFNLHWQCFIHLLDALRTQPLRSDAEKAWKLVESIYNNNPCLIKDMRKLIYVVVGSLTLKAYDARSAAFKDNNTDIEELDLDEQEIDEPEFISNLREQRQNMRMRQDSKAQKYSTTSVEQSPHGLSTQSNTNVSASALPRSATDSFQQNHHQEMDYGQQTVPMTDYNFWPTQTLNNATPLNSANAYMNPSQYYLMASESFWQGDASRAFDWQQWDVLTGNNS